MIPPYKPDWNKLKNILQLGADILHLNITLITKLVDETGLQSQQCVGSAGP